MLTNNFNRISSNLNQKASIGNILTLVVISQVVAAVGLTGWLSIRAGRYAVNEVATKLREQVSTNVKHYLNDYLEEPPNVSKVNAEAIRNDYLNIGDLDTNRMDQFLWHQIQYFDYISAINYATQRRYPNGEFRGVNREKVGESIAIETTDREQDNNIRTYATNERGERTKLLKTINNYDIRTRDWYVNAVKTGKPKWTSIYSSYGEPGKYIITAVHPVYGETTGSIQGIVGTDILLSGIHTFLDGLRVGTSGKTFIIDNSGLLVATSTSDEIYRISNNTSQRISAFESESPLISSAAQHLKEQFGDFNNINKEHNLDFKINGNIHFLQVLPFQDEYGLDWRIVVVVPEADFMGKIQENTRNTILLCLAALGISILIGFRTSKWIVKPILSLNTATKELANGKLEEKLPVHRHDEIGDLARSFNKMTEHLKASFASLQAKNAELLQAQKELANYNQSLEEKVEQRTAELAATLKEVEAFSQALNKELEQGRQIQRAFLPEELPQINEWEIAAFFKPARQVAGDFYDAFPLPDNCLGLVIADVCDKGVGAALFMALFRSLIRLFANESTLDELHPPEDKSTLNLVSSADSELTLSLTQIKALQAVKLTNDFIATNQGDMSMFATLFFGVLDSKTGVLAYVNGGHEPLFIVNPSGGVREHLDSTGPAVGMMPNMKFKIKYTHLEKGDTLIGYTDGVPEAHSPGREFFTKERLLSMLEPAPVSAQVLVDEIAEKVVAHTGGDYQFDDITMIGLRRSL